MRGHEHRHERGTKEKKKCLKGPFGPSNGITYVWELSYWFGSTSLWSSQYRPGLTSLGAKNWRRDTQRAPVVSSSSLGRLSIALQERLSSQKTCGQKFLWRSRNVTEGFSVKCCLLLDPDLCAELCFPGGRKESHLVQHALRSYSDDGLWSVSRLHQIPKCNFSCSSLISTLAMSCHWSWCWRWHSMPGWPSKPCARVLPASWLQWHYLENLIILVM